MTDITNNTTAALHQIVYTSVASEAMPTADLDALVFKAREFNSEHSITGILIYTDQVFVQVLEGERTLLKTLYERIQQDPRHHAVIALEDGPLDQRRFIDWSMGFDCAAADGEPKPEFKSGEKLDRLLETEKGQQLVLLLQNLQNSDVQGTETPAT